MALGHGLLGDSEVLPLGVQPVFLFIRTSDADPLSNPFEAVDELAGKSLGWVPFFPLGTKHTEFALAHNLPFAATQGGRETMYPEYMGKIQALAREEAAARSRSSGSKQD